MTDGELVKVMARLQRLDDEIAWILNEEIIDHPNGEELIGDLHDNGLGYRLECSAIAHPHLTHPERWILRCGRLVFRRRGGT